MEHKIKSKNRVIALGLSMLLGLFGADRFYLGKTVSGFLKCLTLGGLGFWWFIDGTLLLIDAFLYSLGRDKGFVKDKYGNELKYGIALYRFKHGVIVKDWFVNDESQELINASITKNANFVGEKYSWLSRNWKWLIPLVITALAIVFISVSMMMLKRSDIYKTSLEIARLDAKVISLLGEDIVPGFFITGTLNDSTAIFDITLVGSKGEGKLHVIAGNGLSGWRYYWMTLDTIDESVIILQNNNPCLLLEEQLC